MESKIEPTNDTKSTNFINDVWDLDMNDQINNNLVKDENIIPSKNDDIFDELLGYHEAPKKIEKKPKQTKNQPVKVETKLKKKKTNNKPSVNITSKSKCFDDDYAYSEYDDMYM